MPQSSFALERPKSQGTMRPTEHQEEILSLCAPVSSLAESRALLPTPEPQPLPCALWVCRGRTLPVSETTISSSQLCLFSFLGPFKTGKNIKMCAPRHLVLGQPLTINGIECSRASWSDSPAGIHGDVHFLRASQGLAFSCTFSADLNARIVG